MWRGDEPDTTEYVVITMSLVMLVGTTGFISFLVIKGVVWNLPFLAVGLLFLSLVVGICGIVYWVYRHFFW